MLKESYKISKKHNSFLWLPARTGSTTLSWILFHYDFALYTYNEELKDYNLEEQYLMHFGHETFLPPTHKEMDFICTMRHPYDRVLSFYKLYFNDSPELNSYIFFEKFLNEICFVENSWIMKSSDIFNIRIPDYVIKLESLYQDLIKIPFIRDSKLNQCGILQEMCQKKLHNSTENLSKEFLTHEVKDRIYNIFKTHFEIFGYEK